MSVLTWDAIGEKFYETGVDKGVLYTGTGNGAIAVAWNGLVSVSESPSGAEATPIYADNIKYLNLVSAEQFGATIEAYTYPDEFAECDGTMEIAVGAFAGQQTRKPFGLCYRTVLGNDVEGNDYGYKLHLIYNCLAAPSEKAYSTINESPEAITFSWEVSTTPIQVTTAVNGKKVKPMASLTIDSTKTDPEKMADLEALLYGSADKEAKLPTPDEVITLLGAVTQG